VTRRAWSLVALGLGVAGCVSTPTGLAGTCDPEAPSAPIDPGLAVRIEASSDEPVACASCEPQCFRAVDAIRSWDVDARGAGGLVFDPSVSGATSPRRRVPCETPPCEERWDYVDGASYVRTYTSVDGTCDPFSETVLWGMLSWRASLPEGTSLTFELRTARSLASLASGDVVRFTATNETPPYVYVSNVFLMAGLSGWSSAAPYLQVTVVLHPSTDGQHAPVLRGLSLEHNCLAE
jgi:hypothetical protein